MKEPVLLFPVVCPVCKREELVTLPIAVVGRALLKNSVIELYANCHDIYWDAQAIEVEQIREYLAGAGVDARQVQASPSQNPTTSPPPPAPLGGRLPRDGAAAR